MRLIDADELLQSPYFQDESIPERVMFIEEVDTTPTIDPVKHGKWEFGGDEIVYCSACDMDYSLYRKILYPRNYCPNCGAKMDLK